MRENKSNIFQYYLVWHILQSFTTWKTQIFRYSKDTLLADLHIWFTKIKRNAWCYLLPNKYEIYWTIYLLYDLAKTLYYISSICFQRYTSWYFEFIASVITRGKNCKRYHWGCICWHYLLNWNKVEIKNVTINPSRTLHVTVISKVAIYLWIIRNM